MRIAAESDIMAKTIFGTSEKSNFILNMDLDKYRHACGKLMLILLWAVGISQGINQLTYSANSSLADMVEAGGGGMVFALLMIMLRTVAIIFSVAGVFAIITVVIGLMRKQVTKSAAVPYILLAAMLGWAAVSLFHSYDYKTSFFGQDGRDEGWLALLIYAALFYLGTMLRRKGDREYFLRGILNFGIVQGVWGFFQALPIIDYIAPEKGLSAYRNIDPLSYWNVRLPAGLTDSPITYAMLLAMLAAIAIPAAFRAEEKSTRIRAVICGGLAVLMSFRTQTVAGLIAGCGAILLTVILFAVMHRQAQGKAFVLPLTVAAAAVCAVGWSYAAPGINHMYYHPDKAVTEEPEAGLSFSAREDIENDIILPNGFQIRDRKGGMHPALYDGGIVWDDGGYRLSTAGAYAEQQLDGFSAYDAADVLRYCREQGFRAIKIDPLLGVGPDNFYFTQLRTSMNITANANAVDRPYNDLIYIAATRGVPSLLMHLALLILCLVLAWKQRKVLKSWTLPAAGGAVLLYTAASMTGISVLTVAPMFWCLLGMLAAEPIAEPVKAAKQEKPAAKAETKEPAKQKSGKKKK